MNKKEKYTIADNGEYLVGEEAIKYEETITLKTKFGMREEMSSLILLLRDGNYEGQKFASERLMEIADQIDEFNKEQKKMKWNNIDIKPKEDSWVLIQSSLKYVPKYEVCIYKDEEWHIPANDDICEEEDVAKWCYIND